MLYRTLLLIGALAAPAGAHAADCAARLAWSDEKPGAAWPLRAEDLIELRDFGTDGSGATDEGVFTLSPDGGQVAIQLRRAEVASNSYCYGIAILSLADRSVRFIDIGGEPILWSIDFRGQADLTVGPVLTQPVRWSPDGRSVAYLRRDAGLTRLWRARVDGGGASAVPTRPLDVRRFAWSPDGAGFVYEVRPALEAARAAVAEEGRSGYLYDMRLAPMHSSVPSAPSDTPYEVRYVLADGTGDRLATDGERSHLEQVPPAAGPPRTVRFAAGPGSDAAWAAKRDPAQYEGPEAVGARVAGETYACPVDLCGNRVTGLWWLGKGEVLFLADWMTEQLGALELMRWKPGERPVSILRTTSDLLMDCQLGRDGLYCAQETAMQPRRIVRISLDDSSMTPVFDPNPGFPSTRLGKVQRLSLQAADGAPTFADLVLPPGHQPGQRHPLAIVQYHSRGFLRGGVGDEYPVHLFAARGYAVLNFQRPIPVAFDAKTRDMNEMQRINTAGFADRKRTFSALESGVDAAIATGAVDADRIGITGLSEGASSAIWAILSSHRYKAAAISGCCEDPYPIFYGNGLAYARDMKTWRYPLPEHDTAGFWQTYSLALGADRVTAPVLMQLSDQEYRFALQGFGALRDAGKSVELYIFPNEYHNKWQPEHRAAVYGRSLDWFDFWLKGTTDPDPAKKEQFDRWRAMRESAASGG